MENKNYRVTEAKYGRYKQLMKEFEQIEREGEEQKQKRQME
jgi:hypothetical protein